MKVLLVACLAALASPALSKCVGSINVKDFGEVFIVAPDWSVGAVTIHDNGFTLRGNSRIYFASRCEDGWNGDMYAQVTSVTTNMSLDSYNFVLYSSLWPTSTSPTSWT